MILTVSMADGFHAASYCELPKDKSLKFCTQKNTRHQNLLVPQKYKRDIQNVNSSILIYLILEKYVADPLTQKNTNGGNFEPKKICRPLGFTSCIPYRNLSARSTCLVIIACKILSLPGQPMDVL